MNLLEHYFYGKGDLKIFYRKDIPSKCSCIVIIAHGYMEHSGRYIDFAKKLVEQNIGVCIIDHRGNGRSEGPEGDVEDFFDFVEDLKYLIEKLHQAYHKPVLTFGHSMGGLITFLYGLKYPKTLTGQIFSSPALGVPAGLKNMPPAFYESMGHVAAQFKIPHVGESLSTRNQAYLEAFRVDPMSNDYATVRFMDQFLRCGVDYAKVHAGEYGLPCLFLLGTKDKVIPISRNRDLIKKIAFEDKTVKEYESCMHDLLHDLEEEVTQITKDTLTWIDENIKKNNK